MKAAVVALVILIVLTAGCTSSTRYLERGKKSFEAGKYADASLSFREAIQKDRNFGEAYYRLGLSEIEQTDFAGAYRALLRANQLLPERQDVKVALANVCVEAYHSHPRRPKVLYDQLVKLVNAMGTKDPNGYDTVRLRGYLALIDKQIKQGIGYFDRANRLKPYQSEVVINLVDALTQDQQFHEAERLGEEMIQHEKANGRVYDALYSTYLSANDLQGAESVLKRKAANNPKRPDYALQLASYYVRVQRSSEVPAIIKSVLDRGNEFPQVYLEAGNFYSGLRNWEEAKRLYELGIGKDPKNKIAYQKRIIAVLLAQNKKEEAAHMVDTILQEAPKDQNALQVQAVLLLNTRKPENIDKALAQFQALSQQAPQEVPLRIHLAEAYIAKSDWSAARKELSEVLRLNPSMLQARLLLAEIAYTQHQPSEILLQVTPIITADPSNARARLLHAIALMGLGNAVDARNELERLIRDQPKYVDAQIELGLFDLAEKKTQAAEAIFRKFYDPGRTNLEALQGLVTILTLRGQPEEAFRLVDQEAKRSPQPGALRFMLASAATHAGKDDVALEQLQETVKENPRASDAYLLLADIYNRKGDLVQALGMLGKAHAVDPKDFRPVVLMAALEDREGERPQAIASYREAVALRPNDPNLLNDAAYYFAENGGNLDEALQMSRQAVEKLKGQANPSDTLAWIYLKKNMTEPALEILTNLVKKYPDAAIYRYHLGAALAAKGDRERARAELRAALLKKPAKQDEAKIRELLARLG